MTLERQQREQIREITGQARQLLERTYRDQLVYRFQVLDDEDLIRDSSFEGSPEAQFTRERLLTALHHKGNVGESPANFYREAAFTTLNRFAALKIMEARGLLPNCISGGEQAEGFKELILAAPDLIDTEGGGFRLYLESIFDEIGDQVEHLFDRHDPSCLPWPDRQAMSELMRLLDRPNYADIWRDSAAIGWIFQYFHDVDRGKRPRRAPVDADELAKHSQFFTPAPVVTFLTNHTLGLLWQQMSAGQSALGASLGLSDVEDLAVPLKDPRDIKVLDPACGSGHFLLYAFDLLLRMYREAYSRGDTPTSHVSGRTLRQDYPQEDTLLADLPALILRHNLHGIDIDPRAIQIAGLALWLRAKQAWHELKVPEGARPALRGLSLVVAEPMPGDQQLQREFAEVLSPPLLGRLFYQLVSLMKEAGEQGSLIKIEQQLETAVHEAFEDRQLQLFEENPETAFWPRARQLLLEALQAFSHTGSRHEAVRHGLFADDATRGFALIRLLRARYDVILTTPPFGAPPRSIRKAVRGQYRENARHMEAMFVERAMELLQPGGRLGAVTSKVWLDKDAQKRALLDGRLHLEHRQDVDGESLGAPVTTVAFTARRTTVGGETC